MIFHFSNEVYVLKEQVKLSLLTLLQMYVFFSVI